MDIPDATQTQVASRFLEISCSTLDRMTRELAACLGRLTDRQIWHREGAHQNTVANLVLHLSGNMRQWIMHGVGEQPDIRVREKEFSTEFSTGGATTGAELIALFQQTVAEAKAVIASVSAARLCEHTHPQDRDVTVLEAIYQVVGHVRQHVGQIILLTKQMTGQDLDLTIPRPR
jgi:uncharacterized damage-inducible protein DinB